MASSRSICVAVALGVTFILTGCATTSLLKLAKNPPPKVSDKNPIGQILSLWQPAEGMFEGRTCRGFAGQVHFVTARSPVPVEAEGEVDVYLFDDVGDSDEQVAPIHTFKFTDSALKAFHHETNMGQTYSLFVPYTRKGSHEAQCSLRMRYTPKNGPTIYSEMVNIALSGTSRPKSDDDRNSTDEADDADEYEEEVAGGVTDDVPRRHAEMLSATNAAHSSLPPRPRTAVPLDDAERERIVRETQAKLARNDGVTPAAYSEPAPRSPSPSHSASSRRHLLGDPGDSDDYSDDDGPFQAGVQALREPRQHVLSDEGQPAEFESEETAGSPSPTSSQKGRHVRSARRHPVKLESTRGAQRGREQFGSYTISLPQQGL